MSALTQFGLATSERATGARGGGIVRLIRSQFIRCHALQFINDSLTVFVTVFATMFPIVNPLGGAPIFLNFVTDCSPEIKRKLARSVAVNSCVLMLASMLIGPKLLLFFGISLPVLKIAGGAVVTAMGWGLLNQAPRAKGDASESTRINDATAMSHAFYPLTLPLTVGPGSVATAIALVASRSQASIFNGDAVVNIETEISAMVGGVIAVVAVSVAVYIAYWKASDVERLLGESGTNVFTRLFAFILLAIGVQIVWGGMHSLFLEVLNDWPRP